MSSELEFYGANTNTPYPFTGPYNDLTSQVVDAQVSSSAAQPLLVTRFRNMPDQPALLEISNPGGVVLSAQVVVSTFGDYDIWQSGAGEHQATLVVARGQPPVDYTGAGYELVPHVVSSSQDALVTSAETGSTEIAASGAILTIQAGSNISFSVDQTQAQPVVTILAEHRRTGPCAPPELSQAAHMSLINGQGPDARGDLKLRGAGIWVVDRATNGLKMLNVGKECCACEDYAELFRRLVVTNERLAITRDWIVNNQYRYRVLLEYVKFLMRHQIVGGVDPTDTDSTMAC